MRFTGESPQPTTLYYTIFINNKSRRDGTDAVALGNPLVFIQQRAKSNPVFSHPIPDLFAVLAKVDSQYHQPLFFPFLVIVQLLEIRHLLTAGRAPGGPKIQ